MQRLYDWLQHWMKPYICTYHSLKPWRDSNPRSLDGWTLRHAPWAEPWCVTSTLFYRRGSDSAWKEIIVSWSHCSSRRYQEKYLLGLITYTRPSRPILGSSKYFFIHYIYILHFCIFSLMYISSQSLRRERWYNFNFMISVIVKSLNVLIGSYDKWHLINIVRKHLSLLNNTRVIRKGKKRKLFPGLFLALDHLGRYRGHNEGNSCM
jgi:hypothetical protein